MRQRDIVVSTQEEKKPVKQENELHNSHTSPVTYLYTTKDEHTVLLKDIEGMNNCRKCIKTSHMEEENQEETENVNKKHD